MSDSWFNAFLNRLKTHGPVAWVNDRMPRTVKVGLRRLVDRTTRPSALENLITQVSLTNDLLARQVYEQAFSTARFQDPKRLLGRGFKVYSQHDEDGIIEEIFRRIGTTDRFFVEFGVGDGLENCTTYCLLKGWKGAWIEGSSICYEGVLQNLDFLIKSGNLRILQSFITAENIEDLFGQLKVPPEFDLLSIDIDYNDYWVWRTISAYRPRVVAIEYNASFKQTVACTVPYHPRAIWNRSNYYGCSLKALEELGRQKGYCLVGCNYTGVTAFFVRKDLVAGLFAEPFTAENHYEPPRYFVRMPNGHPPGFGPVVHVSSRSD